MIEANASLDHGYRDLVHRAAGRPARRPQDLQRLERPAPGLRDDDARGTGHVVAETRPLLARAGPVLDHASDRTQATSHPGHGELNTGRPPGKASVSARTVDGANDECRDLVGNLTPTRRGAVHRADERGVHAAEHVVGEERRVLDAARSTGPRHRGPPDLRLD